MSEKQDEEMEEERRETDGGVEVGCSRCYPPGEVLNVDMM